MALERLHGVQSRLARHYELIRWLVSVLLGGAVNTLVIQLFAYYISLIPSYYWSGFYTSELIQSLIVPTALLFATPIFLSVLLTRLQPEKRIVPPLYMQLLAFSAVTYGQFAVPLAQAFATVLLTGVYAIGGGFTQDRITTKLFGIQAARENIVTFSVQASDEPKRISEVLCIPQFADNLALDPNAEDVDGRLVMRSAWDARYRARVEIVATNQGISRINIACYTTARYYMRWSESLEEYGRGIAVYIADVLNRNGIEARVAEPEHVEWLTGSVVDEYQGWWMQRHRLTTMSWLKVIFFVVALGIVWAFFFTLKDYASAYATLAIILLYQSSSCPPGFGASRVGS
jgi:hypothetical protein